MAGQVLGVVAQLDPPPGQRRIDSVRVAFQRHGRGAGDLAHHRPAERLAQQARIGPARRAAALEPPDRRLAGLGVRPPVGHLGGPGGEQVVERIQGLDALVGSLGQERLADIAVEPFLLSPPFRRIRRRMDQADAQHRAGAGQPRIGKRRAVVTIEHFRQAAAGDRPAQQILAGAGVLPVEEPAVHQQPGMVIDDQKQPGPQRLLPSWPGHPGTDQHVGNPPLVRPRGLIPAVGLRLGGQRLTVQPGAAQLAADGPLMHPYPVPVEQDRGDLRGRPARQLQPQRGSLGEQLWVGAHRAGIGPRRGLERRQPAGPPGPQPPVDGAPRIPPRRPVGAGVGAGGDPAHQRAALGCGQPVTGRLGDHRPAVQRHLLLLPVVHALLRSCRYGGTGGMKRRVPAIR